MATKSDSSILSAIESLTIERGYPPTMRELMAATGSSSFKMTRATLLRLRDAGSVTWEERASRTLKVVDVVSDSHREPASR